MDVHMQMAEAVRQACIAAALQAYEDAGLSGLCHEGRWGVRWMRCGPCRSARWSTCCSAPQNTRRAEPRVGKDGAVTTDAAHASVAETHPYGHHSTAGSVLLT